MSAQTSSSQSYKFKAEVSQLLDILTHSLYTHRDVYIRELVSNAADALDKVRFKDVKGEDINDKGLELKIDINLDKDNKTFTISDTGIGMTKEEMIQNIGTIARSGTAEFVKQLAETDSKDVNLIGRFGVGFYSVFMAAEKVEVTSKSAEPDAQAYTWTSTGTGTFKITEAEGDIKRGTTIKAYLREDAAEFAEKFSVQTAINKYSNFVPFPISIDGEQINTVSAIWREPKSSIKEEQYNEFYKFIAHQGEDALDWLHFSADVPLQFHSLLFIPKTNFELMGFGRDDDGIHLFIKRVLVDAKFKDLLPPYLRFVRGVVESDDLPLNISRETLQENAYVIKIRNTIVSKLLSHLDDFAQKEPEKYKDFWKQHGRMIKEGYNDYTHKDKVVELFRFNSSYCKDGDELTSLKEYVGRMPEKQEQIYFLSGPSREAVEANPTMEIFRSKGIEVLYSFDPIDEFTLPGIFNYDGKEIVSADQADLSKLDDIPTKDNDKKEDDETPKADQKDLDNLARRIKDILGDKVESVKLSDRLVSSPAVLVGTQQGMSSQMEKIMHMMNQDTKMAPKVMEINPKHPIILNMLKMYEKDVNDELLSKAANSLFTSVMLLDGTVDNPQTMAATIQDLLADATNNYVNK